MHEMHHIEHAGHRGALNLDEPGNSHCCKCETQLKAHMQHARGCSNDDLCKNAAMAMTFHLCKGRFLGC